MADFPVWPENWPTIDAFLRVQTQWREGYAGPIGLDYNAVSFVFNVMGLQGQREIFDGLQIMEIAALKVLRSKD